jgi:hypothetical protein
MRVLTAIYYTSPGLRSITFVAAKRHMRAKSIDAFLWAMRVGLQIAPTTWAEGGRYRTKRKRGKYGKAKPKTDRLTYWKWEGAPLDGPWLDLEEKREELLERHAMWLWRPRQQHHRDD